MTNTTNSIAYKKVITVVKSDKFEIINLKKLNVQHLVNRT